MKRGFLGAVVLLAGCAVQTGEQPLARQGVSFVPDGQGLGVDSSALRVDFGRSPKGVVPLMNREAGAGKPLPLAGCPTGIVQQTDWDGLVLTFTRERFVGWKTSTAKAGQTCA